MNKKIKIYRSMTISNKITLLYSGFFFIMFIILSAFLIANTNYMYNKISEDELNETLDKVEEYIKTEKEISQEKINELNPNKYVQIAVICHDPSRDPFNFPPAKPKDNMPFIPKFNPENQRNTGNLSEIYPEPPFEQKRRDKMHSETFHGERYFYYNRNITVDGIEYTIQVFRPSDREEQIMNVLIVIFLIVNAIGIFISYLIGKFISKRILKPVINVTNTAKSITFNDLSKRIDIPEANDEIRTLAVTFNEMIERLEISVEKQKQFISDASHELRTPISVIQGYANLIDRWGKNDADILEESITSIKTETQQMSNLVNGLLQLAREDSQKEVAMEEINISEIITEIQKEAEMLYENTAFQFNIENNIFISGNNVLIKQLLWIFIENAVKYNKSNEPFIKLSLLKNNSNAVITISDNGIGIADEDIPHIFDRLYRGDKSRNKEISGTGLGLSIANSIIKKHNGTVTTESTVGKGTSFTITFAEISKNS